MTAPTTLFRFENHADVVLLEKYTVTKRTPKGAWIDVYGKKRFVPDGTVKRFAFPTEEEARRSFLARKRRQLIILRSQIVAVEGAIEALKEGRLADYRASSFCFDL